MLLAEEKEIFEEQLRLKVEELENCKNEYETEKANLISEHKESIETLKVSVLIM